ncbi:hypothetical protein MRX96_010455 [Rhipicephalus microplus]
MFWTSSRGVLGLVGSSLIPMSSVDATVLGLFRLPPVGVSLAGDDLLDYVRFHRCLQEKISNARFRLIAVKVSPVEISPWRMRRGAVTMKTEKSHLTARDGLVNSGFKHSRRKPLRAKP